MRLLRGFVQIPLGSPPSACIRGLQPMVLQHETENLDRPMRGHTTRVWPMGGSRSRAAAFSRFSPASASVVSSGGTGLMFNPLSLLTYRCTTIAPCWPQLSSRHALLMLLLVAKRNRPVPWSLLLVCRRRRGADRALALLSNDATVTRVCLRSKVWRASPSW